jgi:flagellin-like protein
MSQGRGRLGISPVVATVILVAVAIVIAIAVAFWASGLVGIFTRFEKLEIISAYADVANSRVVLTVKNTGSSDTIIDAIFINGKPSTTGLSISMTVGASTTIIIPFTASHLVTGGVTNEIALHTTGGKLYPTAVLVP